MAFFETIKSYLLQRKVRKAYKGIEKFYKANKKKLTPELASKIKAMREKFEKEALLISARAAQEQEDLLLKSMTDELSLLESFKHGN